MPYSELNGLLTSAAGGVAVGAVGLFCWFVALDSCVAAPPPSPDHVATGEVVAVRYVERRQLPERETIYHLTVAGPRGDEELRCVDTFTENSCQIRAAIGDEVELWCYEDTCKVAATFKED